MTEPNVVSIDQATDAASQQAAEAQSSKDPLTKAIQNLINAQNSTGPKSEAGKRRSSLNALRHGFCSHMVVMPWEDLEAYKAFGVQCRKMYAPVGDLEEEATQACSDFRWRMRRVSALEISMFTLGHEKHAGRIDLGDAENMGPIQTGLAAALTFKVDADTFLKLSVYEQRLLRQFQAAETRLFKLQADRRAALKTEMEEILKVRKVHKQQNRAFLPEQFGFVSTIGEIDKFIRKTRAMEGRLDPELGSENKVNG